ncbi:MAG TPA: hypothetical protein VF518_01390, partial [Polyangia bacterium]
MRLRARWPVFLGPPLAALLVLALRPDVVDRCLGDLRVPTVGDVPAAGWEQFATVLTAFGNKPIYMLLALLLALWLRGRREPDLSRIRWAMILFFAGESACALSALKLGLCMPLELIHGLGMVAMGALLPWGLLEFLDRRILNISDPRRACVFLRLCNGCWKREERACPLFRLMRLLLPMLVVLSFIPLTAPTRPHVVRYVVWGTPVVDELFPAIAVAQGLAYPLFAVFFFLWTFVVLRGGPAVIEKAKTPFFLGVGFFSYALLRFFLQQSFGDKVFLADVWEELTELSTIIAVGWFLWVFRQALGLSLR